MLAISDIFVCEVCDHNRVEEVLINAVVTTEVITIDEDGFKTYGDTETQDGEVDHYQCALCGEHVDLDTLDFDDRTSDRRPVTGPVTGDQ